MPPHDLVALLAQRNAAAKAKAAQPPPPKPSQPQPRPDPAEPGGARQRLLSIYGGASAKSKAEPKAKGKGGSQGSAPTKRPASNMKRPAKRQKQEEEVITTAGYEHEDGDPLDPPSPDSHNESGDTPLEEFPGQNGDLYICVRVHKMQWLFV